MPEYRMYTVDYNCHLVHAKNIECVDDHEAIQQALRTITSYDVEVWQLDRFVALLPRYEKPDRSRQNTDRAAADDVHTKDSPKRRSEFRKRIRASGAVRSPGVTGDANKKVDPWGGLRPSSETPSKAN